MTMWYYKITIQYDGSNLQGWQSQKDNDLLSIQGLIENALYRLIGEKIKICGAGRTDAGVHALGQVASFSLPKFFVPEVLCKAINFHLQNKSIVVINAEEVDIDFHARFSAKNRSYLYRILVGEFYSPIHRKFVWSLKLKYKLDLEKMNQGARFLLGYHDFNSFRSSNCQAHSSMKTIDLISIFETNLFFDKEINIYVKAKSFLHSQVRIMVGTLVEVGMGKKLPEDVSLILKQKSRSSAGITAPACGLFLFNVEY